MSHFVVMTIGDDYEAQLAPYHEFECTGENDQYVQDVDITEEFLGEMERAEEGEDPLTCALEYYGYENRVVSDESEIDRDDDHKYGYVVMKDGQVIKAVRRTNPNAKWDWYCVGGRWTGFLRLKDGAKGELGRPGVFGNSPTTGFTLFAQSLKLWDHSGKQLHNDRGRNVGHDAQREHRESR